MYHLGRRCAIMEETQENVSTAIFDIAQACLQSFDQIIADYDESQLTQPLTSSESTNVAKGRQKSSYDFLGIRNSFLFWVDYTGALSLMSSSLDARLHGLEDVSAMVLELLEMVLRNLGRIGRKSDDDPAPASTWADASQAIETALNRLHFIAVAIRKASAKQLGQSVATLVTDQDIVFRRDIAAWVRYKFPAARKRLCQQLGDSIAARRQMLLHTERHAKKLALRRDPTQANPVKQLDSERRDSGAGAKQKADGRVTGQPSVQASGVTKASRPDPHSPAFQALRRPQRKALTTVVSSISTNQGEWFEYPPMPTARLGETRIRCPFCLRPLEHEDLESRETKENRWKHHIDEHIQPYSCLFPDCAEARLSFTHRSQWKDHMESVHSKDWLRKVHTIVWYCDIDHDSPETFETESAWRGHMLNPDSHPKRKLRVPTQAQLAALSPRKQQVAPRDQYVCPLCEQIPEKIRPLVETGKGDALEMLNFVVDHVANHLKSLSLMAVPSFDTPVPAAPGMYGKSDMFPGDRSFRNSAPRPPSGQECLSLPSEEWYHGQTAAHVAVSDGTVRASAWDGDYLDYESPEDIPEMGAQEWLEDWKVWRSENDPFLSHDIWSDPKLAPLAPATGDAPDYTTTTPSLEQTDDMDEGDEISRTALSSAATRGDNEEIWRLLQKGADLEKADKNGMTPLSWTVEWGREEIFVRLVICGANIEAAARGSLQTPLMFAARYGKLGIVKLLLDAGARRDAKDSQGRTALAWAASEGHDEVAQLLREEP